MLPAAGATGLLLALGIALAYVNGLHDASNAVSTSIVTRTLSERTALAVAALLNLLGALIGIGLITWTLRGAIAILGLGAPDAPLPAMADAAGTVAVVLIGATITTILWGGLTWWWGMPSSTWHAFYGAVTGAALALGIAVPWARELLLLAVPILLSPLLGAALSVLLIPAIARLTARRGLSTRHLRGAQTVSAGAVATGHGMTDVSLPAAIAVAALSLPRLADGAPEPGVAALPWWLVVLIPLALATGTLVGGHRIIRTLGRRLTDLSTAQGLAAETSAAILLYVATLGLGVPASTTHTVTAGIVGAGWAVGPRTVRWGVVARIAATWVATPLACAAIGAGCALVLSAL